jgi:anti-sigma factor RsiW
MRLLQRLFTPKLMTMPQDTGHVSSEDLAAYLSRNLSPSERALVEQHLAQCESCRRELAAAQDLLARRKQPLKMGSLGLVAVAIAVVLILKVPSSRTPLVNDVPRSRGTASPATGVAVVEPAAGSITGDSAIAFSWSSVGSGAQYHVSLLTDAGDQIWQLETTATNAKLPDSVDLLPNTSYVWYVDALRAGGDSISSGPITFRTR